MSKCKACGGDGHVDCPECDGTGVLGGSGSFIKLPDPGAMDDDDRETECPACGGCGRLECEQCDGGRAQSKAQASGPPKSGFR